MVLGLFFVDTKSFPRRKDEMSFDSNYERRLDLQETVPLMEDEKEMLCILSDNLIMFFAEEEKGPIVDYC